jgi:hypothetical protein
MEIHHEQIKPSGKGACMRNTWAVLKTTVFLSVVTVILAILSDPAVAANERRLEEVVKDGSGQQVALYRGSSPF